MDLIVILTVPPLNKALSKDDGPGDQDTEEEAYEDEDDDNEKLKYFLLGMFAKVRTLRPGRRAVVVPW